VLLATPRESRPADIARPITRKQPDETLAVPLERLEPTLLEPSLHGLGRYVRETGKFLDAHEVLGLRRIADELGPRSEAVHIAALKEALARAAGPPRALGQRSATSPPRRVRLHLTRLAIEDTRQRSTARHDQLVAEDREVTHWRDPRVPPRAVVDQPVLDKTALFVSPEQLPRLRIHGTHADALEREDARGEVHDAIDQDWAAACRPTGYESLVAENPVRLPFRRHATDAPDELAAVRRDTVQMAIVRDEEHLASPRGRRESYRPLCEELPLRHARVRIERGHAICDHRRYE